MKLNPVHYFRAGFPMLAGYVALSPNEQTPQFVMPTLQVGFALLQLRMVCIRKM